MFSSATFILYVLLPMLLWKFYRKSLTTKKQMVGFFFVTIVLGTILYMIGIWLVGAEFEHALNKFDLDGDGTFSDSEYTPEAQIAMKRLTNDTGRTFAPLVAPFVTTIWVSITFAACALVSSWLSHSRHGKRSLRSENATKAA